MNIQEFRCTCGKLLFKGLLLKGVVSIKCRACKSIAIFDGIEK